jgi:hypothetical protein
MEKNQQGGLDVDGRIILKRMLSESTVKILTGLNWLLRIGAEYSE